jgi:hypothetical protein
MSTKYRLYLLSDCWRKQIRPAALALANYLCQYCGVEPATQVHHLRGYACVGIEKPSDLLAVCDGCHRKLHDLPTPANDNRIRAANDNQLQLPLFLRSS